MTKKVYYTDKQIDGFVMELVRQMLASAWKPDYIVGLTRGGLVPALKISHYLGIPMETLKVSLRDGGECESNCWMAEDAYGYIRASAFPRPEGEATSDPLLRKNILIVDDINDTGATLQWIKDDWASGCLPNETEAWNNIWGNNVRFAVLVDNEASSFEVNYSATTINKAEDPQWIVYPWENWWKNGRKDD
jgi:hypoxanthine phosphoribosyltransferase